ncbi:MAG TPA: MFS transporter [Symbiobacteriaceae bacterium]
METIRRFGRSMWVLLAGILLFHAGWYMLLPYLAVLLTTRRGLSPAEVGLVLGAQSVSLLVGSLLGGALADRFGRRPVLVAGLSLRAGGIGALGVAAGLPGLLLAAGVTGLGGGLYGPAAKAGITQLAPAKARNTAFSLRGMAASLGISAGPMAGALLVRGPLPVLFGTAAALHGGLALATWRLLEDPSTPAREAAPPWREVLADLPYVAFSVAATLAWMLFAQLGLAVPLFAGQVLGVEAQIGLLWTLSSLTVVLFQTAVTKAVLSHLHPLTAMGLGTAALGTGLGLVAFARDFVGLLAAVLVFVAGEMLLMPTADTAVSLLAPPGAVGSYFGVSSFAWGMGETLGNVVGGVLMEYAFASGRLGLPWALYFAAGLGIGGFCLGLKRWRELERRLRAAPA